MTSPSAAEFPGPFQALFTPKRKKVFYGGRGGAKSWAFARALLLLGRSPQLLFPWKTKLTILCARELQKSIDESVLKLLEQQIDNLSLRGFYDVQKTKIYGQNGTEFGFEGIKNNVNAIRSYEGVDICWVEEAASVSGHSWEVLIPTIRANDSEIWLSYNPELETDYTHKNFTLDSRLEAVDGRTRFAEPVTCPVRECDDTIVLKVSWRDNPWFPEVLRREMEVLKEKDYDKYLHVWEGACVQNLEGAVYAKELRAAQVEGRICSVPYEPSVPVDTFWDLGRANNTAVWFVQRVAMQWRILDYYEAAREELSHYLKVCQGRGYFYGTMFLPHDAQHLRLGYKGSIEEQFRLSGYRVRVVPKMKLEDGLNAVRVVFPSCWFDEVRCEDGLNTLRHYCYKVDTRGQLGAKPLHDWASDGADAFRYFACSTGMARVRGEEPSAKELSQRLARPSEPWLEGLGGLGWMR